MVNNEYMAEAIRKAEENITSGQGGPFGAVVVKDGKIISACGNRVLSTNDPTAHAEIVAIREACEALESFDLSGCEIYASCEPCPMCLGAIMWARIGKIFYAADRNDAHKAGFDDGHFYEELSLPPVQRKIPQIQVMQEESRIVFEQWKNSHNAILY